MRIRDMAARVEALEAAVEKLTAELKTVKAMASRANRAAKAATEQER
jgi:outer membrane murein-binding lipoprotein Lpp